MKRNTKQTSSAPKCVFCGRSNGVQFNIVTPRFKPFGTACVECEASLPEKMTLLENLVAEFQVWRQQSGFNGPAFDFSADEMLRSGTSGQWLSQDHQTWLKDFLRRWDASQG